MTACFALCLALALVLIHTVFIHMCLMIPAGTNLVLNSASLANNSLVVRGGVGEGENGITCTSENVDCCSDPDSTASGWFSPTGDPLHEGADGATHLYLTRGPGFVRLNRITGGTSALYWCDVPDYSGDLQRLYVGLYTNDLTTGAPHYVKLRHSYLYSRTFTCYWQAYSFRLRWCLR